MAFQPVLTEYGKTRAVITGALVRLVKLASRRKSYGNVQMRLQEVVKLYLTKVNVQHKERKRNLLNRGRRPASYGQQKALVIVQREAKKIRRGQRVQRLSSRSGRATFRSKLADPLAVKKDYSKKASASLLLVPFLGMFISKAPVLEITPLDSYAEQFVGSFLPEFFLTTVIIAVLAGLALKLQDRAAREELSVYAFDGLSIGLCFAAILYVVQLCFGVIDLFFAEYAYTSPAIVSLKLLTLLSG